MIVRVHLARPHGDRMPGTFVVDDGEARALAQAGVLAEPVELVLPQDDVDDADFAALALTLFPPKEA